jgi:hypothetical protein
VTSHPYGIGRQEFGWFTSTNFAPDQQALELGVRFGDVVGRLDTLLIGSLGRNDAPQGLALATAWRGFPVELHAHAFKTDDQDGIEVRGLWSHRFPQSRLTFEAGALSDDLLFGSAPSRPDRSAARGRSTKRSASTSTTITIAPSLRSATTPARCASPRATSTTAVLASPSADSHRRSCRAPRTRIACSIPRCRWRSLAGDDYDGWRIESTVPGLPFTAFYQRHTLDGATLSLAGARARIPHRPESDPETSGARPHPRRCNHPG